MKAWKTLVINMAMPGCWCGWRNYVGDIWIKSKEIKSYSRSCSKWLFKALFEVFLSLPFGPFGVAQEDNPCFVSECPMLSHQSHYSLTTCWNGKQGWPVSALCVCVWVNLHMWPPTEILKWLAVKLIEERKRWTCVFVCLYVLWGPVRKWNKWIREYLGRLKNSSPYKYFNTRLCVYVHFCPLWFKLILHVSLSDLFFIHINELAMC